MMRTLQPLWRKHIRSTCVRSRNLGAPGSTIDDAARTTPGPLFILKPKQLLVSISPAT